MSDIVEQIRRELRSILSEEIQEQAIIAFEALPGGEGKKAGKSEWESLIRVTGFDAAISRGSTGYGGGIPTLGASHGDNPLLKPTEEDVGAWQVMGLPERSATGMAVPPPWILFMDWFWNFLKSSGLKASHGQGFGDIATPYSQLSPAQKRQRKYGVPYRSSDDPELKDAPGLGQLGPEDRTRALLPRGVDRWPLGFHIKREVTIAVQPSLGMEQLTIDNKFRAIMAKAKPESWFRIVEQKEKGVYFVYVNIDSEMPEGWRERSQSIMINKMAREAEWKTAIFDMSHGRMNTAQLRPLIEKLLVAKYGFEPPFRVSALNDEEYKKALKILQEMTIDDVVAFAKAINVVPPTIGAPRTAKAQSYQKMWDDEVKRLADQGLADEMTTEVALSDYMSANGMPDPFDFSDRSITDAQRLAAIKRARKLMFNDISELIESVKAQIKALLG